MNENNYETIRAGFQLQYKYAQAKLDSRDWGPIQRILPAIISEHKTQWVENVKKKKTSVFSNQVEDRGQQASGRFIERSKHLNPLLIMKE